MKEQKEGWYAWADIEVFRTDGTSVKKEMAHIYPVEPYRLAWDGFAPDVNGEFYIPSKNGKKTFFLEEPMVIEPIFSVLPGKESGQLKRRYWLSEEKMFLVMSRFKTIYTPHPNGKALLQKLQDLGVKKMVLEPHSLEKDVDESIVQTWRYSRSSPSNIIIFRNVAYRINDNLLETYTAIWTTHFCK